MWLALDTASDCASVALGKPGDGSAALDENLPGARRHAAALLPIIQRLLSRAGCTLDSIQGVVLSDGPGSFTGLRVGASVAKARASVQASTVRNICTTSLRKRERDDRLISRGRSSK